MIDAPSRRTLLMGALAGMALPVAAPAAAALPARPNFVVIVADDLGWGEIGSQGQRLIATPHLDRLAAEGVRFEAAYSGAPLCAPSRCSLLTGLHAGHATVRDNPQGRPQLPLTEADLTFGELLQLAGYRTACIGKWGFGPERAGQASHPNERGFGEFFGYIGHRHAHQYFPAYLWHNGGKVSLDRQAYAPDLFLQRAIAFITQPSDEPFLLYYASNLPHAPSEIPGAAGRYARLPWTRANRRHAAQVSRLDSDVAQIVQALRDAGVDQDTLVLFTSDNGPHREKGVTPELFDSNGPLRAGKRHLYEGGIRVPLIAWSPKLRPRVEPQPVALYDIMPTLADLAGIPMPDGLDGLSLRRQLHGRAGPRHAHLVWNRPLRAQAVRRGRWKAIRFEPGIAGAGPEGRIELYDLARDVGERRDVSAQRPALVSELMTLLDASIGPDRRSPYGLEVTGSAGEVSVRLRNGSAVPWQRVRLQLSLPGGRTLAAREAVTVGPGEETGAVFAVAGSGPVLASAGFRAGGRRHRFRRAHRLQRDLL